MSKPIIAAVAASIIFGAFQLALQLGLGFFFFSNTSAIVRFAGEQNGQQLFLVSAENASFKRSTPVTIFIEHEHAPQIVTFSSDERPQLRQSGRASEVQLVLGALDAGERATALLSFPAPAHAPVFRDRSGIGFTFTSDSEPLIWFNIISIVVNTIAIVLVYGAFQYFANITMQSLRRRLDDAENSRRESKQELEGQMANLKEVAQEAKQELIEFRKTFHRVRLIYQRKMDGLIRENTFWRRVLADLVHTLGVNKERAQSAVGQMLAKAGIFAPGTPMTDEEFLDFVERESIAADLAAANRGTGGTLSLD